MGTRRLKSVLALILALTLCFSTNVTTANAAKKVTVKSIKVVSPAGSKKVVYVAKGKSVKLTTTVKATPNKKANKKVTYKSANTAIATVSKKGVVKGKKLGTTKITVKSVKNAKKKKTIKVKVVKPVRKVKLNAAKATLAVGQTTKLKAKVTAPKNSFKTLKWTSSNKKVATVTKKGVVKGVGEGTAKITAISLDGTKKKSTCTVTVANGIKSIGIEDTNYNGYADRIKVTLYSKQALTEKDFKIGAKFYQDGIYNKTVKIEKVITADNTNYYLYYDEYDAYIFSGLYVQVAANALKGVKNVEKQFLADTGDVKEFIYGTVGQEIESYVGYNYSATGYTSTKIESGALPKGLTYDADDGYIKGTPQAVADNQKVTFVQTDELGRKSRIIVTFVIGDSKKIVVEKKTIGDDERNLIYAQKHISEKLTPKGGSGSYKFELLDDYDGIFSLSSSTGTSVSVRTDAVNLRPTKAGTYVIKVKITDAADETISTIATLTIKVTVSHEVTVVFNSTEGKDWSSYGSLYLLNIETGETFGAYMSSYMTNSKSYTNKIIVPKGKYVVYYRKYRDIYIDYNVTINGTTKLEYNAPDTGNINVTVKDKNGNILNKSCTVRIYEANTDDSYKASGSTSKGTYTFYHAASGKYIVEVRIGSETVKTEVINVKNKDVNVTVQLKLTENNP